MIFPVTGFCVPSLERKASRGRHVSSRCVAKLAYTLVEILVVLFVLMLVAAIALPTVKDLLSNQKVSLVRLNRLDL